MESEGIKVRVFGHSAALVFEAESTRKEVPTIAVDAALAVPSADKAAPGPKSYDWASKLRLQMTPRELPMVTAVHLGYRQSFQSGNHGGQGKGFSLERQSDKGVVFWRVYAPGVSPRAVPIDSADSFYVTALLMAQLVRVLPGTPPDLIPLILRATQN